MKVYIDREILLYEVRTRNYKNENDVKDMIKKILDAYPNCYHFPIAAGAFSTTGLSDRIACMRGYLLSIEAKHSKNKKEPKGSPRQRTHATEVHLAGGFAIVVNEKTLFDLIKALDFIEQLPYAGDKNNLLFAPSLSAKCQTVDTFTVEDKEIDDGNLKRVAR